MFLVDLLHLGVQSDRLLLVEARSILAVSVLEPCDPMTPASLVVPFSMAKQGLVLFEMVVVVQVNSDGLVLLSALSGRRQQSWLSALVIEE